MGFSKATLGSMLCALSACGANGFLFLKGITIDGGSVPPTPPPPPSPPPPPPPAPQPSGSSQLCDFQAGMLPPGSHFVSDRTACENECRANPQCLYISFNSQSKDCRLHTQCNVISTGQNWNWAQIRTPPPPPPPPAPAPAPNPEPFPIHYDISSGMRCDPEGPNLLLSTKSPTSGSAVGCARLCYNTPGCQFFNYYPNTDWCVLFKACDAIAPVADKVWTLVIAKTVNAGKRCIDSGALAKYTPTVADNPNQCAGRCQAIAGCQSISYNYKTNLCRMFESCLGFTAEADSIAAQVARYPVHYDVSSGQRCDPEGPNLLLSTKSPTSGSAVGCARLCYNTPGCQFFNYYPNTEWCVLFKTCIAVAPVADKVWTLVIANAANGGSKCSEFGALAGYTPTTASDIGQCAGRCQQTAKCYHISFNYKTNMCRFYQSCSAEVAADFVSAQVKPNWPAPSGFRCRDGDNFSNLVSMQQNVASSDDCNTRCSGAAGCNFYTYFPGFKWCLMFKTCNPLYSQEYDCQTNKVQDVNECTTGAHKYAPTATCTNTIGSYTCACNTGYIGTGVSCTANFNMDEVNTGYIAKMCDWAGALTPGAAIATDIQACRNRCGANQPTCKYSNFDTATKRCATFDVCKLVTASSGVVLEKVPTAPNPADADQGTITITLIGSNGKPYAGLTVRILGPNGVILTTVVTDPNGRFTIKVPSGPYTISPVWTDANRPVSNDKFTITIVPGLNKDFTQTFQVKPEDGTITIVIRDPQGDPVANIDVEIYDETSNLVDTQTTDELGQITITVPSGSYTIKPIFLPNRQPTDGNDTFTVVIKPGKNPNQIVVPVLPSRFGKINGNIFNDKNSNNKNDAGEGLPGVVVTLTPGGKTATTNAAGQYEFTNLPAGTYTVTIGAIPGFNLPATVPRSKKITLLAGQTSTFDFRILGNPAPPAPAPAPGTIAGRVFVDKNKDQAYSAGETLISGIQIKLVNAAGKVVASAATDASGGFNFPNLPAGTYTIKADLSSRTDVASPEASGSITLKAGAKFNIDFAIQPAEDTTDTFDDFDTFSDYYQN